MKKTVLITGGSQGLGFEISKRFLKDGYSILICARNKNKLVQAKKELDKFNLCSQDIEIFQCDISNKKQVDSMINFFFSKFKSLDVLVNNASIHGPLGKVEEVDWEEWTKAININIFGTIYLTKSLIGHFKKSNKGKIINISGGGATSSLPFVSAYAISKVAIVRFTESLADELKDYNISVNAIAPGAMKTRLLKELENAGPTKIGSNYYNKVTEFQAENSRNEIKASNLCCYLASNEASWINGKLISAVWDNWKNFSDNKRQIIDTDIYNLRRILPTDRHTNE